MNKKLTLLISMMVAGSFLSACESNGIPNVVTNNAVNYSALLQQSEDAKNALLSVLATKNAELESLKNSPFVVAGAYAQSMVNGVHNLCVSAVKSDAMKTVAEAVQPLVTNSTVLMKDVSAQDVKAIINSVSNNSCGFAVGGIIGATCVDNALSKRFKNKNTTLSLGMVSLGGLCGGVVSSYLMDIRASYMALGAFFGFINRSSRISSKKKTVNSAQGALLGLAAYEIGSVFLK